ncbi:hypothetical protein GCM10009087_16940 [Sphingomonas oligophenolica]|uniref:TetR/AcrR family transcriptional regulator n=1 Tax=Sphingomonas oligophenolica TaxID=301154 RepID=A0ABU9Y5Q1_9SPHN
MDDARVRRSRANLRRAFVDLLTAKPLEQITIRDIAALAGVGYTTYFRHYPNKEALLDEVIAEEIGSLVAYTVPVYDSADSLAACVTLCTYVDQHRPLWTTLLTGGAAGAVKEELLRQGREVSAPRAGENGLPAELGIALAIAVTIELMSWWLRQPCPWPIEKVAEVLNEAGIKPAMSAPVRP